MASEQTTSGESTGVAADTQPPPTAEDMYVVHLYRAVAADAVAWRRRLDATSNGMVALVIAITTFTLGDKSFPHFLLLVLGALLIVIGSLTDARRYRKVHRSELLRYLIDVGHFARLMAHPNMDSTWHLTCARELYHAEPSITLWQAWCARMRTTYLFLAYLVYVAWLAKLIAHPSPATTLDQVWDRIAIQGAVPAWLMGLVAGLVLLAVTVAASISPSVATLEDFADRPEFREAAAIYGRTSTSDESHPDGRQRVH